MMNKVSEAIDFTLCNGLLKRTRDGQIKHAPFALVPYPVTTSERDELRDLTPLFNEVMLKIADERSFLTEQLSGVARVDAFTRRLLDLLMETSSTQSMQLLLSRSDYIFEKPARGTEFRQPKLVEFNMIANSFPFMATQTYRLHRYLFAERDKLDLLVLNESMSGYVDAMAEAVKLYESPNACVLMIVQPQEANIVDQRAIEYQLIEHYGYPTIRMTLEEVASDAKIKNGHLMIGERVAALTYFRAGYTPDDYLTEAAWEGRRRIENSSTIKAPTLAAHLAGTKKIQQVLSMPGVLEQFTQPDIAERLRQTFVGIYALDATINQRPLTEVMKEAPDGYVLKPQREGGGNNLYGADLVNKIKDLSEDELEAYIVMEKINADTSPSILVVNSQAREVECISEIGRYGVCLKNGDSVVMNRDVGYLVRSKASDVNEGGVSAGFACLNSLTLID